jgi:hypothetical protein
LPGQGIDTLVVRMSSMAADVVEGKVMGCSGGEETGDDVVIGMGPTAVQQREDVLRVGRELDLAGFSQRREALDDRFELHPVVGGAGHRP